MAARRLDVGGLYAFASEVHRRRVWPGVLYQGALELCDLQSAIGYLYCVLIGLNTSELTHKDLVWLLSDLLTTSTTGFVATLAGSRSPNISRQI